MHYPGSVRRSQRLGHLNGNLQYFNERQIFLRNQLAKRLAVDEFRGDEVKLIYLADFVNREDVRMIQSRGGAGFRLKAAQARFVGNEVSRQDLQSHLAVQPSILRQINLAHAARTETLDNLIWTDLATDVVLTVISDQNMRVVGNGGFFDEVAGFIVSIDQRTRFLS